MVGGPTSRAADAFREQSCARVCSNGRGGSMPGKRVEIDDETWPVLKLLGQDRMMTFQELADEAFADLLKTHGRPVLMTTALKQSAARSRKAQPRAGEKRGKKRGKKK